MNNKRTVIVGASDNTTRYSFRAASMLSENHIDFVPVGLRQGRVFGQDILTGKPEIQDVHTVTLYVGPANQASWEDYIIGLNPKRIIFNPGTENPQFETKASEAGIEVLEACTLVLLTTGQY